jgi:hypothetical protein
VKSLLDPQPPFYDLETFNLLCNSFDAQEIKLLTQGFTALFKNP